MPIYKNESFTLQDLIQMACPQDDKPLIVIPNIQRPYVWKPSQLAKLVDSLMHGWPCGNLLLWDINHQQQQIFATRRFSRGHESELIMPAERVNMNADDYRYLILDGQQRIQSLIIALSPMTQGYTATERSWVNDGNPKSDKKQTETVTRFLCFDLTHCTLDWLNSVKENPPSFFYLDYDENVSDPLLKWKCQNEIDGQNIVRLADVVSGHYPDTEAGRWLNREVKQLLEELPIFVTSVNRVAAQEDANLDDDDAVVQIFTRLNTAGTPLTKEQIQSAKINSLWDAFPESIANLQHELRQFPFRYDLEADDIVKGFNIVLQVKHKARTTTEAYQKQASECGGNVNEVWNADWTRFRNATRLVLSTLQDKGLHYKSEYQSLYVVWFSVAALCKWNLQNSEELDGELTNLMVKYALVSTWARIWANRSGQFVKSYTESLKNGDEQDAVAWFRERLKDAKLVTPAKDSVNNLAVNHRGSVRQYYLYLWVWSRLKEERADTLAKFVEADDSFEVDHIVPISWIENPDQKSMFNSLGNCWLLASAANGAKSDASMRDFLKGESLDLTIDDLKTPLDCDVVHLDYAKNGENIDKVMRSIATRTERMKEELRGYIESDSLTLVYPKIGASVNRGDATGSFGFYREEEFKSSKYLQVSVTTARQYLRGIKTIINKLDLSEEDLSHCMDNPQLKSTWENHTVVQRYRSGWKKYLDFLFDKHVGTYVGGDVKRENVVVSVFSPVGSSKKNAQTAGCTKALKRLPRVWKDHSIVNKAIKNAWNNGCTSTEWIYLNEVLDEVVQRNHILSMVTESGNSYGCYFEHRGRGDSYQIRFAAPVWELLLTEQSKEKHS